MPTTTRQAAHPAWKRRYYDSPSRMRALSLGEGAVPPSKSSPLLLALIRFDRQPTHHVGVHDVLLELVAAALP